MVYFRYFGIILIGAGLISLFCYYAYESEEDDIHRDVDIHNTVILDIVSEKFRSKVYDTFLANAVQTIAPTLPFPNRELFQNLSSPYLEIGDTGLIHLNLKVTPEFREEYVKKLKLQYPEEEDVHIVNITPDGVQSPPGPDETVWPSTHLSPSYATKPLGVNFYSFGSDLVEKMLVTKRTTTSDVFQLPPLTEVPRPRTNVIVLQPIYIDNEIYAFVMHFVSTGHLIRAEIDVNTLDSNTGISSIMIMKENAKGGHDTLFDSIEDPELDAFVVQRTLEEAQSRGKYCSSQRSVIDADSIFVSVLCTNDSVSEFVIIVPSIIGSLCIFIVCLVMFFLQRDSFLRKKIVIVKEIEIKRKSDFLSEMTHELRTPLNGIMGMCEMLNYSSGKEETSEFIFNIKSGGKILRTLIDNILEFSKVEAGKLNFRPTYENVKSNFEATCSLAAASYTKPSSNIETVSLVVTINESVPEELYLDHSRLRQVLTNLVSNASKFTDKGSINVNVSATTLYNITKLPQYIQNDIYNNKYMLHVNVSDSGIGMSEESINKLFKTFSQVHTDRSVGGSGLGLVVCKKICEDMGGVIGCESVSNQGTTFSSSFIAMSNSTTNNGKHRREWDLIESKRRELNDSIVTEEVVTEEVVGKKISVLIVDDFALNVKMLKRVMEKNDVDAMTCSNGKEAVDLSLIHTFDIIFTDLYMPIMSGIDATKMIRGDMGNPNRDTYIVFLTGSDDDGTEEMLKSIGCNRVLLKPFKIKDIVDILDLQKNIPPV